MIYFIIEQTGPKDVSLCLKKIRLVIQMKKPVNLFFMNCTYPELTEQNVKKYQIIWNSGNSRNHKVIIIF